MLDKTRTFIREKKLLKRRYVEQFIKKIDRLHISYCIGLFCSANYDGKRNILLGHYDRCFFLASWSPKTETFATSGPLEDGPRSRAILRLLRKAGGIYSSVLLLRILREAGGIIRSDAPWEIHLHVSP